LAFELVSFGVGVSVVGGSTAVLYGPPMAMVANTGITRREMQEAAGDVLRHVFLASASADAAAAADPSMHLAPSPGFVPSRRALRACVRACVH
jgi:hypothetical protein